MHNVMSLMFTPKPPPRVNAHTISNCLYRHRLQVTFGTRKRITVGSPSPHR